jgi:hypothetical protein
VIAISIPGRIPALSHQRHGTVTLAAGSRLDDLIQSKCCPWDLPRFLPGVGNGLFGTGPLHFNVSGEIEHPGVPPRPHGLCTERDWLDAELEFIKG